MLAISSRTQFQVQQGRASTPKNPLFRSKADTFDRVYPELVQSSIELVTQLA